MNAVDERARAIGAAARARIIDRLAARLRAEAPDLTVGATTDGVTVEGRRAARDPRLAWIGSLVR